MPEGSAVEDEDKVVNRVQMMFRATEFERFIQEVREGFIEVFLGVDKRLTTIECKATDDQTLRDIPVRPSPALSLSPSSPSWLQVVSLVACRREWRMAARGGPR